MPSDDMRLSVQHMALSMYSDRVSEEAIRGTASVFHSDANPDARALYFKGVHDAIECIETWVGMGLPANTLGMFLEALIEQTKEPSAAAG